MKSAQLFTLEPGRSLLVVTKVHSTGIPVTMNPADPRPAALEAVKALSREQVQEQIQKHRAWWDGYWHKSYVRLDAEPIIERTYYGCPVCPRLLDPRGQVSGRMQRIPDQR